MLHCSGLSIMRKHILIRRGTLHDSDDFASLIVISSPTLFPAVFGAEAGNILKALFRHRHNLFGFQHCHFIEVGGKNAGMMLSYDWQAANRERLKTGLLLLKYMKTQVLIQLSTLLEAHTVLSKIGDGEYYVSNLAIYPEHRGLGLGTRLLVEAKDEAKKFGAGRVVLEVEDEAEKFGAGRVALEVETDNRDAIRLYEKIGYAVARELEEIRAGKETFKFLRMSKLTVPVPRSDATT